MNSVLNYARNNVALGGGTSVGFDRFTTVDVGIANLRFGAAASSGDVDASASIGFSTNFADSVALADAGGVTVSMGLNNLSFGYDTFTMLREGQAALAAINVTVSVVLGVAAVFAGDALGKALFG